MSGPKKRDRLKVEAILWNDAVGTKEKSPLIVPTLDFGVIVSETDEEVTIAHEIFADGTVRDRTTIGKGMIVRRYLLKTLIAPPEFGRYELRKLLIGEAEDLTWRKKR